MTRILAILGSGETAPTMVKTHRSIFESLEPDPVPAVLLDTPYGFQANASDISARAVDYFATSLGRRVDVCELRDVKRDDPLRRQEGLARVAAARWVFAGPGSPSYALRQWAHTDVPGLLSDKLAHGGAVVFASAAALTLGRYTVPVYEIYKVGAEPEWVDGLNLLGFLGSEVAVIPHYDNAEGGNHDTRFCYLGEERLARLESQMGPEGWVLGIDEHTGCVLDLDADIATVVGNGTVTLRKGGISRVLETGTVISITDMVKLAKAADPRPSASTLSRPAPTNGAGEHDGDLTDSQPGAGTPGSKNKLRGDILAEETRRLETAFDASIGRRDVDGAVRALLELDETLAAWSADTIQSDSSTRARAALRRMVVRLGDLARTGARDPRQVVGGFVDALLAERASARSDRRYGDADRVREALVANGVEVRDTPEGTQWDLRVDPSPESPGTPVAVAVASATPGP